MPPSFRLSQEKPQKTALCLHSPSKAPVCPVAASNKRHLSAGKRTGETIGSFSTRGESTEEIVNLRGNATVVAATANYVFLLLLCSHCPLLSPRGGQASGVSMQQQQHLYHSQTDGEVAEERKKNQKNVSIGGGLFTISRNIIWSGLTLFIQRL